MNKDGYLGMDVLPLVVDGQLYKLRVHIGRVDGAARCIGLDVRAFESDAERRLNLADDAQPCTDIRVQAAEGWAEVDTKVYRSVRVAESVRHTKEMLATLSSYFARKGEEAGALTYWAASPPWDADDATDAEKRWRDNGPQPRRGPKARLTRDELEAVVYPAWSAGVPGRIEAVRQALAAYWGERVTIDQAKKAIAKARGAQPPIIPPTGRATK